MKPYLLILVQLIFISHIKLINEQLFTTPLTAGLLSPIAAKAESYKLLVKVREPDGVSTSVLTMANKKVCQEGNEKVTNIFNWDGIFETN